MQPVAEFLSTLQFGEPSQFQNMALFPLYAPAAGAPDYLLLDEALARKLAHVTEVSESGSVPELLFVNDGDAKVLLVDGEELVGARQNRILNVSVLVGAKRRIVIPVSCVEQGRWQYRTRHFASARHTLFSKARARKVQNVSASLRDRGARYSNQVELWADIREKACYLRVASETDSMSDIYEHHAALIDAYANAFAPAPGQSGAVVAIDGKVAGVELFDSPATFGAFMAKVVRSYAMDAIEAPAADTKPPVATLVRKFLADMQAAALERFRALGEGEDLRMDSESIAGAALYAGNRVVHLCAFPVEKPVHGAFGTVANIDLTTDFETPAYLRRRRPGRRTRA
jgi:hypothetical protein